MLKGTLGDIVFADVPLCKSLTCKGNERKGGHGELVS